MTEINQEFEIIKDHDLAHGEIIARSKIKWFNKRGYICTSQSITVVRIGAPSGDEWVISLLFSPIMEEKEEYDGPEKIDELGQIGKAVRRPTVPEGTGPLEQKGYR